MTVSQDMRRIKTPAIAVALMAALMAVLMAIWAGPASAHAGEQGLVLLLPTDVYIFSGAAAVALTVVLLTVLPDRMLWALFRPRGLLRLRPGPAPLLTSCLSAALFVALIWTGTNGPRDPLSNPLTLVVWTVWWIAIVALQGLVGDIWRWLNPWSGPVAVVRRVLGLQPFLRLPGQVGYGLAILSFVGFAGFLMADPAPADPARLAGFAGGYWLLTLLAALAFGPRWMLRAEGISVLMRNYARMGLVGRFRGRFGLGLNGWQVLAARVPHGGLAVFMLVMLGCGSFDGLNETFWWMGVLGVNPLEFPGRSAVVWQNVTGLLIANGALIGAYAVTIRLGLVLTRAEMTLGRAFRVFAPSILPIALGYHIAHYFTSLLVDSQYALAALNDPLARGDDLLGLGTFYVTTGFFNTTGSMRAIFLTQAGAVVIGHVIAVMLAHAIAVRHFGSARRAALSQAPLALFMVAYTFFGLWLLASPRGV